MSLGHGQAYKLRWCTVSDKEQQKCNNFTTVLSQLGNDSNVEPSCVQAANAIECMKKIKDGNADLITLDGGEIYRAGIVTLQHCSLQEALSMCIYRRLIESSWLMWKHQNSGFAFNTTRLCYFVLLFPYWSCSSSNVSTAAGFECSMLTSGNKTRSVSLCWSYERALNVWSEWERERETFFSRRTRLDTRPWSRAICARESLRSLRDLCARVREISPVY